MRIIKKLLPLLLILGCLLSCEHSVPEEPSITKILVTKQPITEYYVNQKFNTDGMEVQAVYSDGTTEIVRDYTLSLENNTLFTQKGKQNVTVTYKEYMAEFTVTVYDKIITLFVIQQIPTKVTYCVGDILSLEGLKLIATFNDGTQQEVTSYTATIKEGTKLTESGIKKEKITFLDKSIEFDITVNDLYLYVTETFPVYKQVDLYSKDIDSYEPMKISVKTNGNGKITFTWYRENECGKVKTKVSTDTFDSKPGQVYVSEYTPVATPYLQASYYCEIAGTNGDNEVQKSTSRVEVKQIIPETGLPVMKIDTVNCEIPTCDTINAPEGCWGAGITNATKVPGKIVILKNNMEEYNSGEYDGDKSGMTIKIRGNTSAYSQKKPYKIKLLKKANLLNDGNDYNKNKEWLLLKDSTLNTAVGLKTTEFIFNPSIKDCDNTIPYIPEYRYMNVILNGEYKGVYLLIESISRDPDGRVDVDKTGYIIERDAYWWNEDLYFNGENDNVYPMAWTFKYPDTDDFIKTDEVYTYIQDYIKTVDFSMQNDTYDDYIDVDSFAKWILAHDILGNADSAGSNMYCIKYDNTENSKLKMTSLWDFDRIMENENTWDSIHNASFFYYTSLFSSENKKFINMYKQLWNDSKDSLYSEIETFCDIIQEKYENQLNTARYLDSKVYNGKMIYIDDEIKTIEDWFFSRIEWMNEAVSSL